MTFAGGDDAGIERGATGPDRPAAGAVGATGAALKGILAPQLEAAAPVQQQQQQPAAAAMPSSKRQQKQAAREVRSVEGPDGDTPLYPVAV